MQIKVTPLGPIRDYVREGDLEINSNMTCKELMKSFKIPDAFKTVAFINGTMVDEDTVLSEPCEIKLVTLVRGG